jgi:myo-inositol catabolism protein IolC
MNYGHTKDMYVLPFDHRASFAKGLFGEENPSPEIIAKVSEYKEVIYSAIFKAQEKAGLSTETLSVLVDEIYGSQILRDAAEKGIAILQTVEKSGQEEFGFEFGEDFGAHLLEYKATFAKALVRYNPEGDKEMNKRQVAKLKQLSDFCHENGIKLLIEPLIPATESQLEKLDGDKHVYDRDIRPNLAVQMVSEMQNGGVECDVWKIEGFERTESYEAFVAQACNTSERKDVGTIILGRGETSEKVTEWINAGKLVPGVIGFAVGRTVFWESLVQLKNEEISKEQAIDQISDNFVKFITLFQTR